jgi:hypothetical protein
MDPENELFDAACELLEATRRLNAAARDPRCARALPATLGCLSSALDSLAGTCMDVRTHALPADHTPLNELRHALERAARLAEAARSSSVLPN